MRPWFLIFLLLPLAEIAGFVVVGKAIGVLATLGLTVATGLLGVALLRRQGLGILKRLEEANQADGQAMREITHGVMIVIAAFLLLIPGFLTDIVGFLLFIPFVRDLAWSYVRPGIVFVRTSGRSPGNRGGKAEPNRPSPVVDLDDDEYSRNSDPNSPWKLDDTSDKR